MMVKRDSLILRLDIVAKKVRWWAFLPLCAFAAFGLGWGLSSGGSADGQFAFLPERTESLVFQVLVLAPIFETLIFQLLPICIFISACKLIIRKRFPLVAILLSASLFSCTHAINLITVFAAFIIGILLSLCFVIFSRQRNWLYAYAMTALLHVLINSLSLIYNL